MNSKDDNKKLQLLNATSSDRDDSGKVFIVLYWNKNDEFEGYNLYRKEKSIAKYPNKPINGDKPIKLVDNFMDLKEKLADNKDWELLEDVFTNSRLKEIIVKKGKLVSDLFKLNKEVRVEIDDTNKVDIKHIFKNPLKQEEINHLKDLENFNLSMKLITGLAYIDEEVIAGKEYFYELRGIKNKNEFFVDDTKVTAGKYILPDPPSGFNLMAGDNQVLALWNRNQYAFGYSIQRRRGLPNFWVPISNSIVFSEIEKDLKGVPLNPKRSGFLDFQRWDQEGFPDTHQVLGNEIEGPKNRVHYEYRIASMDILRRTGAWSSIESAIPQDTTKPSVPRDIHADYVVPHNSINLRWKKVIDDVLGHKEKLNVNQSYKIFRSDNPEEIGILVDTIDITLTDHNIEEISWEDFNLTIPEYGEKEYWYRLKCVDSCGNESEFSAKVLGIVPDITPPGPTQVLSSKGESDKIIIYWEQNNAPDLSGYQIYRSICRKRLDPIDDYSRNCNDFLLIGEISKQEAIKRLNETGSIYYEDTTVPLGSPICYAYWVRAYDTSGNLNSGRFSDSCPEEGSYICQKLHDSIPPPIPFIVGLNARNRAVLVEWISSPIQDLYAFHVYRSEKEEEPGIAIARVYLDGSFILLEETINDMEFQDPGCSNLSVEPLYDSIQLSYLDTGLDDNKEYWYRVSAIDNLGNESEKNNIENIPAISTFTFNRNLPETPSIHPEAIISVKSCGIEIQWYPIFDNKKLRGFFVFRSNDVQGHFRQISELVEGNTFKDLSALRGRNYWYIIQSMDLEGRLSEKSDPVQFEFPIT